jgi:hypothetical protein
MIDVGDQLISETHLILEYLQLGHGAFPVLLHLIKILGGLVDFFLKLRSLLFQLRARGCRFLGP